MKINPWRELMSEIRKKTIQGLKIGDTFTITRTFTEQDMLDFANITRDYNPIHFDKRFARAKKLKGRICHGLLVGSMLTEIGGQIGWLAAGMNFRFKRPVYFGDTIECIFTITDVDAKNRARAEIVYQNQDGVIVLEADLTGILPGNPERRILEAMESESDSAI
jgi:3-hydroxybutyryl-CoA dehydratase